MKVTVHVDGSCSGNPGPAGAGVVITDSRGKILRRVKSFLGDATNNVAEYCALIIGLREAKRLGATKVTCWTDSQLLEKQLNGKFKIKNARLRTLSLEAMELARGFAEFSLRRVDREDNREADELARKIIKEKLAGKKPTSRRKAGSK
ncbi:MAG: ribonuclease HI family protein [Candidatus Hydrogenedentes bacterium]|nr:ribonuclease HI family protein [Candidatus Hydrogenedentota bacterium]